MKFLTLFIALLFCQFLHAQKATKNIYFDFAKSELNPIATKALSNLYDSITDKNTIRRIYLYGYCDSVGKSGYNDTLSVKRVNAVKKFFADKGIKDSSFKVMKGFGKQKPLNKNATEKERQANRRVELIITYQKARVISAAATQLAEETKMIDTSKLKVGAKLILRHINFEGSMHRFLPSSKESLEDLLKVMKDNPKMEIEIIGYICCQTEEFGDGIDVETGKKDLSEARAKAVRDYLMGNGIKKSRMKCKGMAAKNKLILQEITEADKATNRRVEIVVLKK